VKANIQLHCAEDMFTLMFTVTLYSVWLYDLMLNSILGDTHFCFASWEIL
jgi:hypothetical protein